MTSKNINIVILNQVESHYLEVVLWDYIAKTTSTEFLGEVLLDLNQTYFSDTPVWYKYVMIADA